MFSRALRKERLYFYVELASRQKSLGLDIFGKCSKLKNIVADDKQDCKTPYLALQAKRKSPDSQIWG